ncbi:MAG: DUF1440 domain-containing protein [Actinomycetota bacterium]|nr:DUF1440 domain-containing protein [Actinomycetota bacterium]
MGTRTSIGTRVGQGVLAGLAGGIVFGALMAMMGMLGTIAMLVGSSSVAVGWLVHLVISAGFGVVLALTLPAGFGTGATLGAGAGYGVVLWVIGPLLLMPAMMGMALFMLNTTAMMSLVGHVLYGLVAAAVLVGLRQRAAAA